MLWIIGLAFGIIFGILLILYRTAIPRFMGMQKLIDKLNLVSREILTGQNVIRAFGAHKHEEERFDKANTLLYNNSLYIGHVLALLIPLITFIMSGLTVLIVWVGAHDIDAGLMQVGDVMAFIQYTMQIIMAFLMIAVIYIILPRATVSADRINEILDTHTSIQTPDVATAQDPHRKGFVEFKNVSFRYQDSTENVLSNISFTAEPGKTTAVIGSTGSGKSTLINLIPRLFDATEGQVLVGGIDVAEQSLQELRKSIGFVPQKGILFSGTIESNIKFADINISGEAMEKAAKIAQAEEFISTKRKGFASDIAESGSNVSGGQRQRLSIARAIAADPDIFIFDDSFSALDF
jgi:ATP-binding cassette subfamily B protein